MTDIIITKRHFSKDISRNIAAKDSYDIIIEGKSLFDLFLGADNQTSICALGFFNQRKLNLDIINEFLISENMPSSKRAKLFICRDCGDIECGAITVKVVKKENSYVWENFAHENGFDTINESDCIDFPSIEFEKEKYELEFTNIKKWL